MDHLYSVGGEEWRVVTAISCGACQSPIIGGDAHQCIQCAALYHATCWTAEGCVQCHCVSSRAVRVGRGGIISAKDRIRRSETDVIVVDDEGPSPPTPAPSVDAAQWPGYGSSLSVAERKRYVSLAVIALGLLATGSAVVTAGASPLAGLPLLVVGLCCLKDYDLAFTALTILLWMSVLVQIALVCLTVAVAPGWLKANAVPMIVTALVNGSLVYQVFRIKMESP